MAGAVSPAKLRAAPPAPARVPKTYPRIGSRWMPGAIERRDSAAGFYEAINPHAITSAAILVQQALLAKVTDPESLQRIEAARVARRVTQGSKQ